MVAIVILSPAAMLAGAIERLEAGQSPQRLLDVAAQHVEKWGRLVERQEAGERLDGRASIYTGETYAERRDRWAAYRDLLVDHLQNADGGGR